MKLPMATTLIGIIIQTIGAIIVALISYRTAIAIAEKKRKVPPVRKKNGNILSNL